MSKNIIEVLGLHYEKKEYKNGNIRLVKTDELEENSDEWFEKIYDEAIKSVEASKRENKNER